MIEPTQDELKRAFDLLNEGHSLFYLGTAAYTETSSWLGKINALNQGISDRQLREEITESLGRDGLTTPERASAAVIRVLTERGILKGENA